MRNFFNNELHYMIYLDFLMKVDPFKAWCLRYRRKSGEMTFKDE